MTATLHHDVHGPDDAPVLLLGSSLGTTGAMWDPQLAALRRHFRVVRFDHRGHGGSAAPPGLYTIDDLGGDVLGLLDQLGVARASYCGLSLGGMVGMWLAAHAPERVDRLVLCSTSALLGPAGFWTDRAATVRAHGMDAVADQVVDRWLTPAFRRHHPEVRARMVKMLVGIPAEPYANCCEAIAAMDLRDDLASVTAPTLVVMATDDPATPPEHGREIARRVPDAQLVVVPDAAHLVNVEQPEVVTRLLVDHLTASSAGGGHG